VHPTGGSRRVFRQFTWLEVGSGKVALSRPAHPRVTQAVGQLNEKDIMIGSILSREHSIDDKENKC
jgi:hypothetical protein